VTDIHPIPVEIFRSTSKKPCAERALVLHALGIPHQVVGSTEGFALVVPANAGERATRELELYSHENVGWPPPRLDAPMHSNGVRGALVYAVTILAFYPIGRSGFLNRDWWSAGRLEAGTVLDGEWWRTITALTLHGSAEHLIGNLMFGGALAVLASHTLGTGLTWMGMVLAGALGNLVNALVQSPQHTAIGASTAVFGCLGLMSSYEWIRRHALHLPRMRRLAPMLGGAVLLGYMGMGGASLEAFGGEPAEIGNTDVVAHVTGMLVGVVLGFAAGKGRLPDRVGTLGQRSLAAAAVGLVAVAWIFALA
ncbi:MAG: rhomboid family intramembrane serine protease, partial [Planctomycetota bacterium]